MQVYEKHNFAGPASVTKNAILFRINSQSFFPVDI